ncbi:TPA: hypothetical protein PXP39_003481 [Yersinia enterocolitica]|nr:hypothetical protein [Yersinia enterocolitica]HDL7833557.1 hypothetical protein [Yersinia enterocolitica]HDL7874241.1 hypothetical protein [Yersinia enterocolitica]HDL7886799.1 hypothetical protein [Yersinia enterocolitica]HDL7895108.1 hypothetical protein [Yersinia enterocolitica]
MSFNVGSIRSAITTAVNNTKVDGRFHKADMKTLAGQMKEIKNSSTIMKMDNQISKQDAAKFTNDINGMIKTLNSQGSGMHKEKMSALTELKTQLKSITSQNSNNDKPIMSKLEEKEIHKVDLAKSMNSGNIRGLGFVNNDLSSRRFN